jgi:hypothetical protein
MPHVQKAKGQPRNLAKYAPEVTPRDDLRTAYSGDANRGPKRDQKPRLKGTRSRRISEASGKTPVR